MHLPKLDVVKIRASSSSRMNQEEIKLVVIARVTSTESNLCLMMIAS